MITSNNLLELTGTADLIATAICDFQTPLHFYKKGDVVLNLTDVNIQCITLDKSTKASSKLTDLEYTALAVNMIQSSFVPLDYQLYNLIGSIEEVSLVYVERVECMAPGMVLLKDTLTEKEIETIKINQVEEWTYRIVEGVVVLESTDFATGAVYDIQYSKVKQCISLPLNTFQADIPYLQLQYRVKGNVDKVNDNAYIMVGKTSMHYLPILNFDNEGVTHCNLNFVVINDSNNIPKIVVEYE